MSNQFTLPFASVARQFAQSALKANTLAFEGFERIVSLQLKSAEAGLKSSVAFLSEATDVTDLENAKEIWPKSVALVKNSSEQLYSTARKCWVRRSRPPRPSASSSAPSFRPRTRP